MDDEETNSFVDEEVLSSLEDEDEDEDDDEPTMIPLGKPEDESAMDDDDDDDLDDDDDTEFITEDEFDFTLMEEVVEQDLRYTSPYFTKYELAKILPLRSAQLESNAPSTTYPSDYPNNVFPSESMEIAMKELELKKIPIIIRRPLPNGEKITISANSLLIPINIAHINA